MRQQIQTWGSRTFMVVLLAVAVQRWGIPMYKQYFTPKKTTVFIPTAKAKTGQFTVSFHEIGALQAEKSVFVQTETSGKILYLITEGTVVKPGQRLVLLDTADIEREVRSQQLKYQNVLAEVDRVKEEGEILKETNRTEMEKAEAQFQFDQTELEMDRKDLERQKRLAADKLVSLTSVENAELKVRSGELTVEKGKRDLALTKKEIESKERQKQKEVRNAEFRANMEKFELEELQGQVTKAQINAPAPGMVVISKFWGGDGRRKYKEGDNVNRQQTICELPDLRSMLVKVQVGEADAPKARLGMPTIIRLEALPNKVYHGTISDISALATEASPWDSGSTPGRKNFEVTISVKEVDPKTLKPGMTADVEFICDHLNKATYVPLESVIEESGKTYVYVKGAKGYKKTLVKVGKQNDNFICITHGLKTGDIVALRDPTRPIEDQEPKDSTDQTPSDTDKKQKNAAPIPGAAKE